MATRQTSASGQVIGQAERAARSAVAEVRPWIEFLARLGFAARGVVYGVVGILAFRAAFGAGGATTSGRGALRAIGQQPFGRVMLTVVAVGLAGFALWKLVEAVLDPEGHGERGERRRQLAARLGAAGTSVAYWGLALAAVRILQGSRAGGGDSTRSWTAALMAKPFGVWLVALAGLGVVVLGIRQLQKAFTGKFLQQLRMAEMSPVERDWARRAGELGLSARGVVFLMTGGFLVRAALKHDASEARGLGGALAALAHQPSGPWLLGLVAVGLIAFGIYGLVQARYRRIAAV